MLGVKSLDSVLIPIYFTGKVPESQGDPEKETQGRSDELN